MITLIPNGTPLHEFNHAHDQRGRFASGHGGGVQRSVTIDTPGGPSRATHYHGAGGHFTVRTTPQGSRVSGHEGRTALTATGPRHSDRAHAAAQDLAAGLAAYNKERVASYQKFAQRVPLQNIQPHSGNYNKGRGKIYAKLDTLPQGHARGPAHPASHGADRFFPWLRPKPR